MSPPSPLKPSSMSPGSPVVTSLPPSILSVGKTNNAQAKKLQIIETPSFENKINDLAQETSGEETVEAETSETESKFSSDDEENDDSSLTPPEDYVEHVEVELMFQNFNQNFLQISTFTFFIKND